MFATLYAIRILSTPLSKYFTTNVKYLSSEVIYPSSSLNDKFFPTVIFSHVTPSYSVFSLSVAIDIPVPLPSAKL